MRSIKARRRTTISLLVLSSLWVVGCGDKLDPVPPLRIVHDVQVEKAKVDPDLLKTCGTSADGLPATGQDTPRNWARFAAVLMDRVDCYHFRQDKVREQVDTAR